LAFHLSIIVRLREQSTTIRLSTLSLHDVNYGEFGVRGVGVPGDRDGMVGAPPCRRSVHVCRAHGDCPCVGQ